VSDVRPVVCFLCTGNAARSVMARVMFADRAPGYRAVAAGTLVLEGHPMSQRTRLALADLNLSDMDHRSRQFGDEHAGSDLIVAMEPGHVAWIRRHHPEVAARTATLPRLVRHLPQRAPWTSAWQAWIWRLSRSRSGRRSWTLPRATRMSFTPVQPS